MKVKKQVVAGCVALLLALIMMVACTDSSGGPMVKDAVSTSGLSVSSVSIPPADDSATDSCPTSHESETAREDALPPAGNSLPPDASESGGAGKTEPPPAAPPQSSTPKPAAPPAPAPVASSEAMEPPAPANPPPQPASSEPEPTPSAPTSTSAQPPASESQQSRTICNTCGADITGNVPAHGDGHLLNGENFSYRVE